MNISLYDGLEVINMCYVTATELKNNLSYYLEKSKEEDIYITKNNRVISVLVSPQIKAILEAELMITKANIDSNVNMSDEDIICEAIERK